MADPEFLKGLTSRRELEITVTGRKSGRSISTPVWFVHEGGNLYLLPVKRSDSEWYKNVMAKPEMQISAKGRKITVKANPLSDPGKVEKVVEKFRSKYGAGEIRRYYSKLDAAIEVSI
jgi:deazaflavin-dependent oxidoreductase (nitroreductase family)